MWKPVRCLSNILKQGQEKMHVDTDHSYDEPVTIHLSLEEARMLRAMLLDLGLDFAAGDVAVDKLQCDLIDGLHKDRIRP